jgi:plasmid replication initiation protein
MSASAVLKFEALADRRKKEQGEKTFTANFAIVSFKDDIASMEAPIFSLSTKPDHMLWSWTSVDGKKSVTVAPGYFGRATQHDKDVLIYCASQIIAAINAGEHPPQIIRFVAHDFLVATKRGTSGDSYLLFKRALNRLKGTQITTNIYTGKVRASKGFGLIDSWSLIQNSPDARMVGVEIKLSDWLYRGICAKEILTINPNYFLLRKALERRIYEIARKHVGRQELWEIGIEAFKTKCGSKVKRLRQFRDELKIIIKENSLLDYQLMLTIDGKVRIYTRDTKHFANRLVKKMKG